MPSDRFMLTLPPRLREFLRYMVDETDRKQADIIRTVLYASREYAEFQKARETAAREQARASAKTTVVIEAKPTREQMLAEEQERRRQERWARENTPVDPPWPTPNDKPPRPLVAGKEANCRHGNQISDFAGNTIDCFECAVEEGKEVCHEHQEAKPCPHCSMDEIGEAAP